MRFGRALCRWATTQIPIAAVVVQLVYLKTFKSAAAERLGPLELPSQNAHGKASGPTHQEARDQRTTDEGGQATKPGVITARPLTGPSDQLGRTVRRDGEPILVKIYLRKRITGHIDELTVYWTWRAGKPRPPSQQAHSECSL